jgi:hypothetical protein
MSVFRGNTGPRFLHHFLRGAYSTLREKYVRMRGTSFFERKWKIRPLVEIQKGFSNLKHPHPQTFPGVRVVGTDINPILIEEGNKKLVEMNISSAELRTAPADKGSLFPDKSFDIVLTDALLLYQGPDKIMRVIKEMKRMATKAIILVELHEEDGDQDPLGKGYLTSDGWVRSYKNLFRPFFPEDHISIKKIPPDIWPEGRWPNCGFIITARFPFGLMEEKTLHPSSVIGDPQ